MLPDAAHDLLMVRARARIGAMLGGKYRLDELLGVGGMAAVYRATHRNGATFALKVLHPELALGSDVRARFLREGYIANSIKHHGVARVVDDEAAVGGDVYIVMELLEGMSVDRLGERLPIRVVVALGLGLLDVLVAAHEAGVVHRDIKPANIFVGFDGRTTLLDFGIARAYDAANSGGLSTAAGVVLGTPAFMAPEQALGAKDAVGARADLWALGAAMFTVATGRTVHVADSGPQFLVLAATRQAQPIRDLLPDMPAPIADVIDRALALEVEDRWADAAEMRAALHAAAREAFDGIPGPADLALLFAPRKAGHASASDAVTLTADFATPHRDPTPPGAAGFFRAVVQTARELGVDADAALIAAGIDPRALDAGAATTPAQNVDFFEHAAKIAGDPSLGVKIAFGIPLGASGALDYATRTSSTFGDALARMSRLYGFVSDRVGLVLEEEGDRVHLIHHPIVGAPTGPQITEFVMTLFLVRGREVLRSGVPLLAVSFTHARIPGGLDLTETFGAPVAYEQQRNEMVVPRSLLEARLETSDPLVAEVLERHTQRLTGRPTKL